MTRLLVASSARLAPSGGISPVRSLRTPFSHVSAWTATLVASRTSSASPPDFNRLLWQVTQYCDTKAGAGEAGAAAGAGVCRGLAFRRDGCGDAPSARAKPMSEPRLNPLLTAMADGYRLSLTIDLELRGYSTKGPKPKVPRSG